MTEPSPVATVNDIVRVEGNTLTLKVGGYVLSLKIEGLERKPSNRLQLEAGQTLFDLVLEAARTFIKDIEQSEFSAADLYHMAREKHPELDHTETISGIMGEANIRLSPVYSWRKVNEANAERQRGNKTMNTESGQRIAIYARVSSQEQAVEGVSIEAQIAALKAYAKSQGWGIVDEYIDGGFSGGTDDRPAFVRMLHDARQKSFNIITVCKLDRFFRNLRLLLNYLYELEQLGIKFVSTQEGLDTSTPYGKFAVQIMGVIAEFERGRIGERVKDSRHYLIAQDKWAGGRPPYGYRWLAKERKWEVVASEVEIVRFIYDLYINKKLSIDSISKILNDKGLSTRNGAQWNYSIIRTILTHPGYKGRHQIGVTMPPLIDETTWRLAQEKREKARSMLVDPKGWLLQGMCFCGECGYVLKCQQKKRDAHRYYVCRGRIERTGDGRRCDLPYIRAERLERAVWLKIQDVLRNKETLAECVSKGLADLEAKKSHVGAEMLAINNTLETIRAKKERLGIAFADGAVNESIYKLTLNKLKKQEASLFKCRHDIDPSQLADLAVLEDRIAVIKEIISKGSIVLTEFGIYALTENEYVPVGFNAFRESDGKLAIGEVTELEIFQPEGSDKTYWGIGAPPAYNECKDTKKRAEMINKNLRGIMQLFSIKVFVYPDYAEIKGTIPPQMLEMKTKKKTSTAPIIGSPSLIKGRGKYL